MPVHPRPELANIAPAYHGGYAIMHPRGALDFSSNVNPYGPAAHIWDSLRSVPIGQHPDPRATPVREFLAQREQVDPPHLIVGNGSVDLIQHLAVAFARSGDRALIGGPTFGEYARAAAMMGADIVMVNARAENDFAIEPDALLASAAALNPRLLFLCNPNNPTGALLDLAVVERLLRTCPETLCVVDEAFISFASGAPSASTLLRYENLCVLRSLTKDYALTGLRVGYAMASPTIVEAIEKVQPPWSVNAFAQAGVVAALRDENHLRESLAALARAKVDLVRQLEQMNFRVFPSAVHYFLMRVDSARNFTHRLREQNIFVRDATSFGLPEFVRIAPQRPEDNARLVQAIQELECPREP